MSTWRLKLQGDGIDLEDLATQFPHGPRVRVFRDGEGYFLELPQAGEVADDTEAVALGRAALNRLTSIDRLTNPDRRPVAINAVSRFDETTQAWKTPINIAHNVSARMAFRAGTVITNPDGSVVPGPSVTDGEALLEVVETEQNFARALYLYDRLDHDWRGLYMVLEAVEDGSGGEADLIGRRWVPDSAIKNFKKTANSYNALGEQARHGSTSTGIAEPKMTIDEARSMIHQLLRTWAKELRAMM